jgi:NAD(P)-dependent dehydrogenase (short-subunit alcohol dehydrogenase family)
MFRKDLLSDKRILITGGGTGLGKAMAHRFLELGATVYICGRRETYSSKPPPNFPSRPKAPSMLSPATSAISTPSKP